jgi:hypothetical protein
MDPSGVTCTPPARVDLIPVRSKVSVMLQARLQSILRREVESQNLQLTSYGVQKLESLIGQGMERMRINHAVDHPSYVMRAERNLAALIKYFCDYSRDVGTFPSLSNSDFDDALTASPTFWPFRSSG